MNIERIEKDIEFLKTNPDILKFLKIAADLTPAEWAKLKILIAEAERGLQVEK